MDTDNINMNKTKLKTGESKMDKRESVILNVIGRVLTVATFSAIILGAIHTTIQALYFHPTIQALHFTM